MNDKLTRLKAANPSVVALAQQLTLKGFTVDAIAQSTGLGLAMIEAVFAEKCPDDIATKVRAAPIGASLPKDRDITYGDVRALAHGNREYRQAKVADTTTQLREALLGRALNLVNGGGVASWRDIVSGLRVLGVPTAGAASEAGHGAGGLSVRPTRYIYDDGGQMIENPAYLQWLNKGDAVSTNQVVLNIGADLLRLGGTAPIGEHPLRTDDDGNIVALQSSDGATQSLTSLTSSDLHRMAFGASASLKPVKQQPLVSMDDLI